MTEKPSKMLDDILSYREMCEAENQQTMQRGMNYRMNPAYSVILMSQRDNAPYADKVHEDGITIEYEGHDVPRRGKGDPKRIDQVDRNPGGTLTQNGLFAKAVDEYKLGKIRAELVKAYEKIQPGIWSMKGFFDLIDYKKVQSNQRNVYRYILKLADRKENTVTGDLKIEHARLIPSEVKREVWKRDGGKCVMCGEGKNLHYDHDLPFSKGGTSLSAKNVRLLCMKHNLAKGGKIE